ncbi:hypothetical protein NDU88_002369 [Pleurodeles waltl]|uniref:Uncharacterized protein n=1 Tax=Pleurodeles waltl TaxID=8319 RepID=A0AAV7Q9P6_PLEWA|nr:hypothetical protein NDU88_002369 [Pleurodeles waltl]
MCKADIIEPVDAAESVSPIVLVRKKTGDLRLCADLREKLVSRLPQPTPSPPQSLCHQYPTPQQPPNVPRTRQSAVCPPVQGPQSTPHRRDNEGPGVSGSGDAVQGTQAPEARDGRRTAVCQGEYRSREPTAQEALTNVLGAYKKSQNMMGQVINIMQENQRLQGDHQEIKQELLSLNTTMLSFAGVLGDMANSMRYYMAHQRAPSTSQCTDQSSTYATASGQEALPQDSQATSTPPPAEGEPSRKWSLRRRQTPETLTKTKTTTGK